MTSQQHPIINFRETYKAKLRSMTDLRVNGSLSSLDWSREHNEKAFWECGGKKLISSTRIHRHKGNFFLDCEISLYIVHCICRLLRWFVVASVVQVYGTLLHSSLIVQVLNKFLKVAINSLVFSFVRSFTWLFQSTSDIPTYSYDNEHVWEKSLFLVARQSIRMFILCTYEWPRNSNTVSQWI